MRSVVRETTAAVRGADSRTGWATQRELQRERGYALAHCPLPSAVNHERARRMQIRAGDKIMLQIKSLPFDLQGAVKTGKLDLRLRTAQTAGDPPSAHPR